MKTFENKVVLVTGGNRNTGLWLVKKFVDEDARVFTCARNAKSAEDGIRSLGEMGVKAAAEPAADAVRMIVCDISKLDEVTSMFDAIEREAGRLDVLVNNAANQGLGHGGPLEMDPAKFNEVFGVNVVGGFQVTQQACKRFFLKNACGSSLAVDPGTASVRQQDKGVVVFLSSNTAMRAIRGRTAYCSSKGAINSMVRALALDLAPLGIRVNCCAPGYINTSRWDTLDPEIAARRRANCPLGREASGEDIANVVAFLASPMSGNMTGEIVTCDAGCSCQHMPADVDR